MRPSASLSSRFAVGVGWMTATRVVVHTIGLASTVVLARLLAPEDFGLVAVAMALYAIVQTLSQTGFNSALIHYRDAGRSDYDTVWTMNLLIGLAIAAALYVFAAPFSHYMDDGRLQPILYFFAIKAIINGGINTAFLSYEKSLHFRPIFIADVCVKVGASTTTIVLALIWRDYWALVVGGLIAACARVGFSYALLPYRPRVSFQSVRRLFSYAGWLTAANVLMTVNTRLDNLILQKLVSTADVGAFVVAKEVAQVPISFIGGPIEKVLFPSFVELNESLDRLRSAYFSSISALFAITAPMSIGIALVADDLVRLLLGAQWQSSIFVMQCVGPLLAFQVLGVHGPTLARATGRTKLIFYRNALYLPVRPTLFVIGALSGGLPGAVIGYVLSGVLLAVMDMSIGSRVVQSRSIAYLRAVWRSVVALLLMTLIVLAWNSLATWTTGWNELDLAARLLGAMLVGGITYGITHFLLWVGTGRPDGNETRLVQMLWRNVRRVPAARIANS